MTFFIASWYIRPDPQIFAAIRADSLFGFHRQIIDPKCDEHMALIMDLGDRAGEDPNTIIEWIFEHAPSAILSWEMVEQADSPIGLEVPVGVIEITDPNAALAFKLRFPVIEAPW